MGVFQQLFLLFKKNFILRKRQPITLVLEVAWPVLIVAVIAIIRQGVPPQDKDTCHYQKRAMPSAGVVPFLQTFVCNLDNQCHSPYTLNRAQETTYSVSKLVQQLAPSLASDDVIQGLLAMDQGVSVMDALVNIANDSDLLAGLDSMLTVRSFFQDPNYVKQVLVANYKVMNEEQADALLDSTVNITMIFDIIGYPDFRGVACNPARLSQFLLFKPDVDVRNISASLCIISTDRISEISRFLQSQFDIAELVRVMGKFEKLKKRLGMPYTSAQAFGDIADMVDLAMKSPSLQAALASMSSLRQLPDLIRKLPEMIDKIKQMGYFDMAPFVRLVGILDPVVEAMKPNDTIWYAVKYTVLVAADLSDLVQQKTNGSATDTINRLFGSAQKMLEYVQQLAGAMQVDFKLLLGAVTQVDWLNIYDQIANGAVNTKATEQNLQQLQTTLQSQPLIWNVTAPVVMVINRMLDISTIMIQETKDLETVVSDMVNKIGPAQSALTTLFNKGPNITMAVLSAFTDSKALARLFEYPFSYQAFCNGIMDDVAKTTDVTVVADLRAVMCTANISASVNNLFASLRAQDIERIMDDTVTKIRNLMNGEIPPANLTMVFLRAQDMATAVMNFVDITNATWRNVFTTIRLPNIDLSERQWEPVLDQMNQNYVASAFLAMFRGFGTAMDNGNVGPMIGQYVHMADSVIKNFYKYMQMLLDIYSPTSTLGRMVQMVTTYAPELLQAMSTMAKNPSQIVQIVSITDPMAAMCSWVQQMPLPAYVPHTDMSNAVCYGLPEMYNQAMNMTSTMNTLVQQIVDATQPQPGRSYDLQKDWSEIMDYTERTVTMLSQQGNLLALVEGPVSLMTVANFTRMEKTFAVMGDIMEGFTYKDMASFMDISLAVIHQLEPSMQNSNDWKIVEHSVLAYNAFLKLVNHYYTNITEGSSYSDLLRTFPAEFQAYARKMASVTPDFIEALKNTILNPEKLVKKIFDLQAGFAGPDCSTSWLTDFLDIDSNSSLIEFERETCSLNWTAFGMDLLQQDPYMQEYTNQVAILSNPDLSSLPDVTVNWTEVMVNTERYLQWITEGLVMNSSTQFSMAPFNVSAIDMKWTEFVAAMKSLENVDIQRLGDLVTMIQISLEKLGMTMGNSTDGSADAFILNSLYGQLYINHHTLAFLNKILTYFSTHGTVNVYDYLGSDELKTSSRLTELAPEFSKLVLDSLVSYFNEPQKIYKFLNMPDFLGQLCSNMTVFTTVFDTSKSSADPSTLQTVLCSITGNLNYTAMYMELRQNWDGFAQFADAITGISLNTIPVEQLRVNASTLISDQLTFMDLINRTIMNPPNIVFFTNNNWMNATIYTELGETFLQDMNVIFSKYQDPGVAMEMQLRMMLTSLGDIPEARTAMKYMEVMGEIMLSQIQRNFEPLNESLQDFPNMLKIVQLMNDIPFVLEVTLYTNLVASEKTAQWSAAMQSFETFCGTDPANLFSIPPTLQFSMAPFLRTICTINITALMEESQRYSGSDRLTALISGNMTEPVNVTALPLTMMKLIETLTNGNTTYGIMQGLPRLFDAATWTAVIERMGGYLNQSVTTLMSPKSMFLLAQNIVSSVPGLRSQLKPMEIVMIVLETILDRVLILENATSFAPRDIFPQSPQLQAMIDLLQEPGVLVVLMESLNSQKMTPLFAMTNVTEVFMTLCWPGANISQYLVVPPGVTFDVSKLQSGFCAINITQLEPEVYAAFDIPRIQRVANGLEQVDWLGVGAKFQRVYDLVTRWVRMPPTVVLPANWENGSYWLNMLEQYAMARQDPAAINAEIESLLTRLGPLMMQEPFRQYGIVMEAVMRLLNENIVGLQNKSLTVTSMFDQVPILRDVITAIGLRGDMLETVLTAPVKDTELFTRALLDPTSSNVCTSPVVWRDILLLPATFNFSALTQAICSQNTSIMVANLIRNLDLERVIAGLSNMSVIPDWKLILSQSQVLAQNINNLIQNPPAFNVSASLAILQTSYNETNLWNLVTVYNAMAQVFGNSSEFQAVEGYMNGASLVLNFLNDLFQKMAVNGVTLDLGSVFSGSPTFTGLINTMLHLRPDPITALASVQLKNSQSMAFSAFVTDPQRLATLFCDETVFLQYFNVAPGFNLSSLLPKLCRLNFTNMASELDSNFMVSALIAKFQQTGRQPFNMTSYMAVYQQLNNKIMELTGVRNVSFGDYDLERLAQVNMTALLQALEQQSAAAMRDYPAYINTLLDSLQQSLRNTSDWKTVAISLKIMDLYLKYFNDNLETISGQPLSLELLVRNTELGRVLLPIMSDPLWLDQLLQLQIKADKLQELLQSPDAGTAVCSSALWEAFVTPTNTSALEYLQQQMCSINTTVLMWQTITNTAKGYQFYQQMMLLMSELERGTSTVNVNTTELTSDLTKTINLISAFANSLTNSSLSADNFVNVAGFQNVLNKFQSTIMQKLIQLSSQLSTGISTLLWPSIPDPDAASSMARSINTMKVIMDVINNRLEDIKGGNISLNTLAGKSPALLALMEAYINVTKFGLQAWMDGQIDMQRIIELMSDQSMVTSRCQAGTVAAFISNSTTPNTVVRNLQTVLCTYMTDLPREFSSLVDYQQIQQQISDIWNSTVVVRPDFAGYSASVERFSQLVTQIAQSNIQLSQGLKNTFDFSSLLNSLNNLVKDPSLIFTLLKPFGLVLDKPLQNDVARSIFSGIDSLMLVPVSHYLQILSDNGLSFSSILTDPMKMIKAMGIMADFDTQISLSVEIVAKPMFKHIAKNTDFITNILCNTTLVESYILPLVTPGIANILCHDHPTMWVPKLRQLGLGNVEIYGLAGKLSSLQLKYHFDTTCSWDCPQDGLCPPVQCNISVWNPLTSDITWVQFLSDMEKMTKLFLSESGGVMTMNMTAIKAGESLEAIWNSIGKSVLGNLLKTSFGVMKGVDIQTSGQTWSRFKQIIHFVGTMNSYLNGMLEKFTNSTSEIYLQDVFPDSKQVAKLLAAAVGQDTAAEFLTALFNPLKIYDQLANPATWVNIFCDPVLFNSTFTFPSGTHVGAIQTAMCTMAVNQSSSMEQLINLFDAGKVLKELQAVMASQPSNTTYGMSLWDRVYNTTTRLISNLEKLQHVRVNGTATMSWFSPILATLQALQNPTMSSGLAVCNDLVTYLGGTDMFREVQTIISQTVFNIKLIADQMPLLEVADDFVCTLVRDANLKGAVDILKTTGIFDSLTQTNPTMNPRGTDGLQCSVVLQTGMNLWNVINSTFIMGNGPDWDQMGQCFVDSSKNFRSFAAGLNSAFSIATDVMSLIQDPSLKQLLNAQGGLTPVLDFVLRVFTEQRTVLLKFSDLLKNDTTVQDYLTGILKLSPELVTSILKSSINLDSAMFLNQPVEQIQEILCNATRLGQVLTLPDFTVDIPTLSRLICTNDSLTTASALKSAAEAATIIQQALIATSTGLNQQFFNNISNHVLNLVGDLQLVTEIAGIFSGGFNVDTLRDNIPKIDRFLMSSGPERIVQSLTNILEDIQKVLPANSEADTVLKEIGIFIRGLAGLDIVQSYFLEALTVSDFVKSPTAVYNYLIQIGMSPSSARTVLEGTFSINVFLNSSYILDANIPCTEMFSRLLSLNTTMLNIRQVTDDLCRINETVALEIANLLIPQLTLGDLLQRYVTLSGDDIFKSANITSEEASDLATKLNNAQKDLVHAAELLTGKSNTMNYKSSEMLGELFKLPQAQTGAKTMDSIQPLLCGKKPGDLAGDDFNVASVLGSGSKATVSEQELSELAEADKDNGGDFCQQLYNDIQSQNLGSIIWAYLKPIMRGKILYTPDTPLTRQIISKANNVFDVLKDVQRVAKAWSVGTPNLMAMTDKAKQMGAVKDILKNDFITSLLKQTSGLDAKQLLTGIEALDSGNFNSSSMKGMKVAADLLVNYTSCMELERFVAAESEEEMEKMAFRLSDTNNFLAGVVFTNLPSGGGRRRKRDTGGDKLPDHVEYKIRMESENVRITNRLKPRFWEPDSYDRFASHLQYLRGFMQLQDMVERAIIAVQTGENATLPGVYLKQFPFPCISDDSYIGVLGSYLLPVVMTFAWLAALAIATRNLVIDREEGLEDALRIMGMKPILNWFAWLVSTLILMVVVSGILTIILKFSHLFRMSDPSIVFLYLICFCFSSTMLVYFVSSFFTRVTLAILMVLIVYFLSYLPYIVLVSMEVSMVFWQKTIACLLSTSAFGFAAQYLSRLEMQNIGLQWDNIASSPVAEDPMTFSWACYMMLIDSAIYLFLGWYVRTIMPGKFGTSEPWYFPVSPSYWCGRKNKGNSALSSRTGSQNVTLFESSGGGSGIPGMAVRNLTKKYGKKVTVDNISADFYEGQVTALLGHNGAAKTTTMKMLIGILEPTSGEVFINQKGSAGAIGFCPQHNTLLDYMTVLEHMELYSGIKCDWSSSDRASEIKSLLSDVDLYHVRYVRVSQLSGGMKRRLCVALAFVGGSTAVVLDEPTSGVDPHARKHIWNLITKQRLERTILLSTHHLDEADTVGDTIAIMHEGHILCCGSPMFLKGKLGGGYHLTVEKATKMEASGTFNGNQSDCTSTQVLAFMKTMLPKAQLVEEFGTEMTFNLPREDSVHTPFDVFFRRLDEHCNHLCISSYGVSDTTLEDVFLKVTALADDNVVLNEEVLEKERLKPLRTRTTTETASDTTSETSSQETTVNMLDTGQLRYSGLSLKLQQMSALLMKRFHHYRRDWRMYLSIVLLPFLLFLASMGFARIRPEMESMPSLLLTPDMYGPDNYMFFKDMSYESLSDRIAETLTQKPGVGTVCLDGFDSGLPITCDWTNRSFTSRVPQTNNDGCKCENFKQQCAPGSVPIPRHIQTPTGNYLQDLLGEDISQYLLHSFDDFLEKRYGGWSYEVGPEGTDTDMAATVWFNNEGYHAMPAFFNAFSNSLLRAKLGQKAGMDPSKYGISVYSHPITLHTMTLSLDSMGQQATDAGISLVFLLAFTFISTAFMVYLVNENLNKEKQLQFISGVGPVLYWVTSFIWDMLLYSFTVALAVVALAIFQLGPYWDRQNLAAVVSLIMLYGWSVIPLMYMTLKLFKSASAAYLTLFCINMLIGILTIITIFVLIIFQTIGTRIGEAFNVCRYLFLIFPQFCMGQGLIDVTVNHYKYLLFARFGDDVYENPFSFEMLGWNLLAMGIQGLVFFIITIIIESKRSNGARIPSRLLDIPEEDGDVHNERLRIQHGQTKDDILYVNGLSKIYRRGMKRFLAVDNLCFGVSKGECFGLLGVNGAGKTTTFRMLTGDTNTSSGAAYLNGHKISTGDPYLGQEIGYCPQEGGLDGFLSGEEILFCHAKLKGMSEQYARKVVVDLVGKLHLAAYAQKAINTYSGGTKRKLSLAIAMLGEPPVLFLDEPTSGMDPATRRLVWKCISKAGQNGQSIVLTSHSMDECDSLCSRLAIMVNGRLMCLGSAQHLKTKFGDGYTVTMHIQGLSNNRFNIEQAFLNRFPGATIKVSVGGKDQHTSVLEVGIPRNTTSVSELFSILQTAQEKNHITRYSLSQTTLDTVFVNFAQEQSDSISDKDDDLSTSGGESGSEQSGILPGPFSNQTYAYMNPQYMADPQDERFSSQYAANLAQASTSISMKEGKINKAFDDDNKVFDTRL
ncbi:uncharacterized protein LOC124139094 isoform X1 [Haliotis rufescens]|uniref:uncharacterized protein LOC124139094 isoform X1 n=1 Tax=Haliotis rufescens TaxID=6454 RepID=UPI00201F6AFA|nr:uncharacterized protein LOC124139094 isoform X1 [Haliotis rufescens]XP_046362077.2 uncharacterized protein LOC124139094 isoform X1 [Haliotis rufescens]XP_046362083.2 uncharacterized protein LOC124139094 isoform X1 [Haliotis rufescens]